jgi:hypothetical protein
MPNKAPQDLMPGPHEIIRQQKPRMGVNVSRYVKEILQPIFNSKKTSGGAPSIVKIASKLDQDEALRLLSEEKRTQGREHYTIIWVTVTPELVENAQRNHLSPHVLVRAAAIKVAKRITNNDEVEDVMASLIQEHAQASSTAA